MPRKQSIIIFPSLNDRGGDLSRKWYVEYKWRIPGETKQRIERIYKGLDGGTDKERRKIANKVIAEKTQWLKSGEYLNGNVKKVYADELLYRNEAKMYGQAHEQVVTTRTNLSEFLTVMKQKVNAKSYENYVSKLRIFSAWLKSNDLHTIHIKNISRKNIIDFSAYLSENQKLSRLTIKKYIQIIHTFFDYELEIGTIDRNPAEKIPTMGKIVDCAAVPFVADDRARLKEAISKDDPQLWLACQMQFYCAIRPGTELRLIKLKWIDWDNSLIRIPNMEAKNNKTEIVNMPSFLIDEMKELYIDKCKDKELYLFGKNGRPGTEPPGKNTLRNRFNRYREALGINPAHKFYSWKHTGAAELLKNGAQPYDVKNHLRHASFATTEIYLKKIRGNDPEKISNFTTKI